ncbi:MAG: PDZ domain-containing protein [Planctomycetota bacterium]
MTGGWQTIGAALLLAVAWATPAMAQDEAPETGEAADAPVVAVEEEVVVDADRAVLDALDAPDYATREAATRALLTDPWRGLASLRRLWDRATTMEARHRLLSVIRHQFLVEQAEMMFPGVGRGAIGVSHRTLGDTPGPPAGAQVVATLPGFPGHAHLRVGDVITAIEGRPLQAGEDVEVLSERVQQLEQGAVVSLSVWRGGVVREIAFPLGSMNALVAMYGGQGLGEPFASRLAVLERELWASAGQAAGAEGEGEGEGEGGQD